jgi:hypothetical protein
MAYLASDPAAALGYLVARLQSEEHKRGVWAPLEPRQARQLDRLIDADRAGQVTRDDIRRRVDQIARSMA